jgi:hypothetical protein
MTFEQQKLAFMVAWVLTVSICGVIVSVTSSSGAIALAGVALIPPALAYRLFAAPLEAVPERIDTDRR